MAYYRGFIKAHSHGGSPTYVDISDDVRKIVEESGIRNGICAVISSHTTCSVFFDEFVHDINENGDEFLQEDLNHVLDQMVPPQTDWGQYKYPGEKHFEDVEKWPDIEKWLPGKDRTKLFNCDAHLRATLLGSSEVFDIEDGKLFLSTNSLGRVYFVDFDRARERDRIIRVTIVGEK